MMMFKFHKPVKLAGAVAVACSAIVRRHKMISPHPFLAISRKTSAGMGTWQCLLEQ
jgi:hypothetical protein